MQRSIETADQIAELACPTADRMILKELQEINWGIWEGKRSPDISELLSAWQNHDFEGIR